MYKVEPVPPEIIAVRAGRIREVRAMLGITRKELIDLGISIGSLQNWEDGRQNGLSRKGAQRLVEAFRELGGIVTEEWLMEGTGPEPVRAPKTVRDLELQPAIANKDLDALSRDMLHQLYANVGPILDAIVPNDDLSPIFAAGDCVAGVRCMNDKLEKALNQFCIVQTMGGKMLIGYLSKAADNSIELSTRWQDKTTSPQKVEVYCAAPIIFHLRTIGRF